MLLWGIYIWEIDASRKKFYKFYKQIAKQSYFPG